MICKSLHSVSIYNPCSMLTFWKQGNEFMRNNNANQPLFVLFRFPYISMLILHFKHMNVDETREAGVTTLQLLHSQEFSSLTARLDNGNISVLWSLKQTLNSKNCKQSLILFPYYPRGGHNSHLNSRNP